MSDETKPEAAQAPETELPQPPVEFPEKLFCPQCKRLHPVTACHAKSNTLLTDVQIVCPRCKRRLRKMKMKDWYDHYVQRGPNDLKTFDVFRSPQTSLRPQPRRMGTRT